MSVRAVLCAPHPRRRVQTPAGPEDAEVDGLRVALSAAQGVCGPIHQVPRTPLVGTHHRQVSHQQKDRVAGWGLLLTIVCQLNCESFVT